MTLEAVFYLPGGKVEEAHLSVHSIEELGRTEPEGVYTITRTFLGNQFVLFDAHLDRLEESARLEGIPLKLKRNSIRSAIRDLIARARFDETRLRISIPKGHPERILIAVEPLVAVPDETRLQGVPVATHLITRPNPKAKTNLWENLRADARVDLPADVFEGVVRTKQGVLLEGFSSNFYAIEGGVLRTSSERILHGVARKIVLTVLEGFLPIDARAVSVDEIESLEESFLSSSSRGVVPIIMIDGVTIGDGSPGPLTREIIRRYDLWVASHLEPI
jgi:branched-chain amino acid aminotransferase